ncbi:MAG: hypothetical protein WBB25_12795 [Sulfitobacter sp.]
MPHLHHSRDPRHTRMFELLRQREVAETTMQRLSISSQSRSDVQLLGDFRTQALRSLKVEDRPKAKAARRIRFSNLQRQQIM